MSTTTDGRSARWEEHRQERRKELVESAMRTIRSQGAGAGMDDIAAGAGTSKTVFYRHFTDRHGLYLAVAQRVDELILREVGEVLGQTLTAATETDLAAVDGEPRRVIAAAIGGYLALVEQDPELYRFIVAAPIVGTERSGGAAEVAADATGRIAAQMGELIAEALVARGHDPAPAKVWGTALVGMVRAGADAWLAGTLGALAREQLTEQLSDLAWRGVSPAWSRRRGTSPG